MGMKRNSRTKRLLRKSKRSIRKSNYKRGGVKEDTWTQYGDVSIRQKRGIFGLGNYYIVQTPVPDGRPLTDQSLLNDCQSGTPEFCGMIHSKYTDPHGLLKHIADQVDLFNEYGSGLDPSTFSHVSNFIPALKAGTFTKFEVDISTAIIPEDLKQAMKNLKDSKYKGYTSI